MLFLGIDGGGTKTKVIIINEEKKVLYEGTSGPSSLDTVGESITIKHINEALSHYSVNESFTAVFAGLGGVSDDYYKARLNDLLRHVVGVSEETLRLSASDMENALASGLYFEEGLALIAGTGMVAYGKNKENITHKAGGLGYKEGDLGSSYDLGINAIRSLARALDNRYQKTAFTDDLQAELGISTASEIATLMDKWQNERTKIANLAPFVTKHANLGNRYAIDICNQASRELALSVKAVQDTISLATPKLVVVGSLGNSGGYFKEALHGYLKTFIPGIEIIEPKVDPAYAAALLALYYYNKQLI